MSPELRQWALDQLIWLALGLHAFGFLLGVVLLGLCIRGAWRAWRDR